jgi:ribosome-associated protein
VTSDESNPTSDALRLDQFLKLLSVAETGGRAKLMIQNGEVKVNGEIETRRRRKLALGDIIEVAGQQFVVKEAAPAD